MFPWEPPTQEEQGAALMEVLLNLPIDTCPKSLHGWVHVTAEGSNAGFTGAPIWWAHFSCGCIWVDTELDSEDAAR